MVLANPTWPAYGGLISGTGSLTKTADGKFTYTSATGPSGAFRVSQGTLAFPFGLANIGAEIVVSGGATLEAGGLIKRALGGNGILTATDDLLVGKSTHAGQFNLGGTSGSAERSTSEAMPFVILFRGQSDPWQPDGKASPMAAADHSQRCAAWRPVLARYYESPNRYRQRHGQRRFRR